MMCPSLPCSSGLVYLFVALCVSLKGETKYYLPFNPIFSQEKWAPQTIIAFFAKTKQFDVTAAAFTFKCVSRVKLEDVSVLISL